jgi:NTE family protein
MDRTTTIKSPHTFERALVLGGAGTAGYAWEIGVVAGLFESGLDVTKADLIIGTSAGSTVAVNIASGTPPTELLAAILAFTPPPRTSPGGSRDGRAPGRPTGLPGDAIIAEARDAGDMRRRLGAAALAMDGASDPAAVAQRRTIAASRLSRQRWPKQLVRIVAVDAHTGEPAVFDRHSGVDLADAVTASTASFTAPPHTIAGKRYIDGGYRRNENADLAAGSRRVLVLSPFSGRTRYPLEWGMQLAAQAEELSLGGSKVETIFPDGEAREIFGGTNQMNPSLMHPAAQAGHDQGKALAKQLVEFWS